MAFFATGVSVSVSRSVLRGVDASADLRDCVRGCNRDIWKVIRTDLQVWPLYDLFCYSLIGPSWRPIITAVMSSAWATYMSAVSARTAARAH